MEGKVSKKILTNYCHYLAWRTSAKQPAAKGAALDVPWNLSVQP